MGCHPAMPAFGVESGSDRREGLSLGKQIADIQKRSADDVMFRSWHNLRISKRRLGSNDANSASRLLPVSVFTGGIAKRACRTPAGSYYRRKLGPMNTQFSVIRRVSETRFL